MARPTLESIGRLAGVSRSTVSRVVNGSDNVRPEVRDRVLEVIRRTGYQPNLAARSLASQRSGVIGLVIPSGVHVVFADPYFARLIEGVTRATNGLGLIVSLFLFHSGEEERALYPRVVSTGLVDGVIVTATRMGDTLIAALSDSGMPHVVVGRPDRPEGVAYVDVDNIAGGRVAAEHLIQSGYRRIAMIGAPLNTTAGQDRRLGFVEALELHGAELPEERFVEGDYTEQSGFDAMRRLLDEGPDAVFAATDAMAAGAMRALRSAGVRCPEDVAVMGFDGFGVVTDPPLTTVAQPVVSVGSAAVEMLHDLMSDPASEPRRQVLPVEFVEGRSTVAVPAVAATVEVAGGD